MLMSMCGKIEHCLVNLENKFEILIGAKLVSVSYIKLQSKQVKRSSHEWINKFIIIANLISLIILMICSSDE